MPVSIVTPVTTYSEQRISLGGIDYRFIFRYNRREGRWRFDIFEDETAIALGIKVMENQNLTERYLLDRFSHGNLYCVRSFETEEEVSRDNFGVDKAYELLYYTTQEEEALLQ